MIIWRQYIIRGVVGVLALGTAMFAYADPFTNAVVEKNPNCSPVPEVKLASPILPELDYKACCKAEDCTDLPNIGCNPDSCVSTDLRPDGCEQGYLVANCESDSKGTICEPEITQRLQLTRVVPPEGTDRPLGCCVYCPEGDANCEACTSVDSHDSCGALIPAECSLYFGNFGCQGAPDPDS